MAKPKAKGIPLEEERRPLPDTSYVSLTEGVTWIVEHDSRDDAYLHAQANREAPQHRRRWHSSCGTPDWLLPHLDLMRQGLTPDNTEPDEAKAEADAAHGIWRGAFEDAEAWLAKRGGTAEEAYQEVAAVVEKHLALKHVYSQFYKLLADRCSVCQIELQGIESRKGTSAGVHTLIPPEFFLRPFVHCLCTEDGRLTPNIGRSLADIFGMTDSRADYHEVRIKRDDVQTLKRLMDMPLQSGAKAPARDGDTQLKQNITKVLAFAGGRWPGPRRPSRRNMAICIKEQQKDQGFSVEAVRKILAGTYPPMKRLGVKGLDDG